ncbi:hydantoinase B/oxoprolinase family protein [Acetobacter sp.]|uniref:hydantoinase B/oxoprolinase family protein n=1 Tax=Acetobacter sp. TaxID=440 RepID=UPI0025BA4A14|nr:hydantoinase B/oxoprolinase family protein [Acetobacter sp.]MCH4091210.1 hydantoinase B/oxoprolinase family protein [Acetobacter sp.]
MSGDQIMEKASENGDLDPILLQVIRGAFETIANEMAHVLHRMSFSSIIRESEDLGAGLFDSQFNTLCESESTPMHIGSIPAYLRGIQDTLEDGEWYEGDIVVHNHPYHGSSHSPDLAIVMPIFHEGRLIGFAANTAHHVDIGAATPGLIIDVPDVFAEGMLFAGNKLYRKGQPNKALWNFIRNNSRAAQHLVADIEAQIASVRLGKTRFLELVEKYSEKTVLAASAQLMDYAERMMRQKIAAIPDGEYAAKGYLDDDGRNRGHQLPVVVTVRVTGDSLEVDLTGSASQTPTAYNVPFEGSTKVAVYAAFRKLLLDSACRDVPVPSNEGSFRPITVTAPLGSIYNPVFPASAEARFTQCNRLIDLILRALAPVMPEQVIAGSSASISFAAYSGLKDDGNYWVFLEVNEGAYGGRPKSDGPDSIDNLMANTRNNPIEDLAMHLPMRCERYELRDDVLPGAGEFRGGIGVVKSQKMLSDGFITHESERHTDAPWGLFAGHDGAVGRCTITSLQDNKTRDMPSKFSGEIVKSGDMMTYFSPNGGGYGNPLKRSPAKVLDDVLDGFCSVDVAHDVYGVVLDLECEVVDESATRARRQFMMSST